jgi:hypothetical protein
MISPPFLPEHALRFGCGLSGFYQEFFLCLCSGFRDKSLTEPYRWEAFPSSS